MKKTPCMLRRSIRYDVPYVTEMLPRSLEKYIDNSQYLLISQADTILTTLMTIQSKAETNVLVFNSHQLQKGV